MRRAIVSLVVLVCLLIPILSACRHSPTSTAQNPSPQHAERPALAPPTPSSSGRAIRLAGKGIELYSWKPAGKDWHFSLLIGTNRNKTMAEIKDPQYTVEGTKAIEEKLSRLAKGETVTWLNLAKEPVPKEITDEIASKCKALEINLQGPLLAYRDFQ